MNKLLLGIIALSVTGCTSFDRQKFAQSFADGMEYQAQRQNYVQQNNFIPQMQQQPRIDFTCVNNYPQQNVAYALKVKNCSY